MLKTLAFAIAIAAVVAAFAPAQAMLSANGTSLNGIATGAAPNGQIIGIELPDWRGRVTGLTAPLPAPSLRIVT